MRVAERVAECNTVSGAGPWALVYDHGNQEDTYTARPPESEVQEAREAAPDSPTYLVYMADGWDRMTVAWWPAMDEAI